MDSRAAAAEASVAAVEGEGGDGGCAGGEAGAGDALCEGLLGRDGSPSAAAAALKDGVDADKRPAPTMEARAFSAVRSFAEAGRGVELALAGEPLTAATCSWRSPNSAPTASPGCMMVASGTASTLVPDTTPRSAARGEAAAAADRPSLNARSGASAAVDIVEAGAKGDAAGALAWAEEAAAAAMSDAGGGCVGEGGLERVPSTAAGVPKP